MPGIFFIKPIDFNDEGLCLWKVGQVSMPEFQGVGGLVQLKDKNIPDFIR